MADQYILGNVIGKGSYGEVTLATHKKDKKKFVIKTIDLHNASEKERLFAQQEVDILSKLRHPNIVSYKESFQTKEGYLAIVMGYCEGGDLYSRLKKQAKVGEYLSETQTVEWFVQIAMALQYMHDRNILHRDLKTQNVFLTKSKIIKLGDLGIARVLDNNVDMATTMIGTPYYMSPELFSNKPYNHKSDVWALGCCVYEMATLKHAFNARDMNSLVYKILKGKTPPMPKHYSTELQDIIKAMLNYDPMQRPSASRILRHSFIKKHIALFLEGTKNRRKSREEKVKKPVYDSGYSESSVEEKAIATASKIDIELESSGKIDKNAQKGKSVPEDSEKKSNVIKEEYSTKNNINNNPKAYVKKPLKDKLKRIKKPPDREEKKENQPIETSEKNTSDNAIECEPINSDGLPSRCNKQKSEKRKHEIRSRPLPPCPVQPCSQSTVPDKNRRNISSKKHEKHQVESEKRNGDEIGEILPPPRFNRKADQRRAPASEDSHRKDSDRGIPNMAARRKRREKQQELDSKIISPRVPVKKDSITSIVESHSPRPREEIVRAHIQRMSYNKDSIDCTDSVDGPNEHQEESEMCSPVERSETSVDEDEDILLSDNKNKNNEDVENLIDNLQATLKLDSSRPDSSRSPEQSSEEASESVISATGRLNDRISRLRRECTEALGEKILQKAYDIMDNQPEKNIEASLLSLLGRKNFNLYGGQIWQLKFCEEFQL